MRSARTRSAPTIADVARSAGVSPMTVSRVVNGEANVRPKTVSRVKDAIAQLNYSPNPAARALAGARTIRLGLLYNNPGAGYFASFLVGALEQARRHDVQLILEPCTLEDHGIGAARHLMAGGIDGLLVPPPICDSHRFLATVREAGMPAVLIGSGAPAPGFPSVGIDDHAAAAAMTRHILARGHRRIGFVVGDRTQYASGLRLRGFRAAMAAAGVTVDERLIVQGDFTYRSGLAAAETLLARPDRPTAIFASNDDMAAAAVAVAHRLRIDVPDGLTVCGFDNTVLATVSWPELTTIDQPIADMARAAVTMLTAALRAPSDTPAARLLDFTLVARRSDGPPPAALPGRMGDALRAARGGA